MRQDARISVIIPTFNEEKVIKGCIESARLLNPFEIIVVDGGSTDRTKEIARENGAIVIQTRKGRGNQMNKGASLAEGEILFFLHADTIISNETISSWHPEIFTGSQGMLKKVQHDTFNIQHHILNISDKYVGGFFKLKFDDNSLSTKLVEFFANLRARLLSLPYGDQAIFIKRDAFVKIGGFREYPFLEDIDLVIRLRKFGKLKYIPHSVIASSRRIKKEFPFSPILVSLRNVLIALLFILGVEPSKLVKLYK
ncbi:MAG: TIGR04283 family arsenosugar biosynthesis glycosyltransferase [Nitrospirae bacterium]|nr:TIGR04283 family arsenosugar biosynthesis glycosyltransferase [Nitrospirota bacterium]